MKEKIIVYYDLIFKRHIEGNIDYGNEVVENKELEINPKWKAKELKENLDKNKILYFVYSNWGKIRVRIPLYPKGWREGSDPSVTNIYLGKGENSPIYVITTKKVKREKGFWVDKVDVDENAIVYRKFGSILWI